jgi:16S rRNA (cytosine1402-N4)-methyltransferase
MTTDNNTYHVPVMLRECLDGLNINPDGVYVDVTFGGGGHSREIFKLLKGGKLIVFDQDPDARKNAWEAPNFHFVPANFEFLRNHLRLLGIQHVDGVLADLGVSSYQFDQPSRGFSIRTNEPLDMRMNTGAALTAYEVVNTYEEQDLMRILGKFGEINSPGRVANRIVTARSRQKIKTTGDLVEVLKTVAPFKKENQFLAQVFQAIRIVVNDEMGVLERFLLQTPEVLKPGGRLVVMSYHSLEDRLVKNFMKRGNLDGTIEKDFYGNVLKPFDEITRKPIAPSDEEININPRARSAKLRIAKRNE